MKKDKGRKSEHRNAREVRDQHRCWFKPQTIKIEIGGTMSRMQQLARSTEVRWHAMGSMHVEMCVRLPSGMGLRGVS